MANSQNVRWEITGISDLGGFLSSLNPSSQARILKTTMDEANKPIIRLAKSKAPKKTGALRKSIGSVTRVYAKDGKVVGFIGARRGTYTETEKGGAKLLKPGQKSSRRITPAKYSHLVEYGHKSVNSDGAGGNVFNSVNKGKSIRKGTASSHNFVSPRPFLRPALDQGKQAATGVIVAGFEKALNREYARAKRQYNRRIVLT